MVHFIKSRFIVLLSFISIAILCHAQYDISPCIGKDYISKGGSLFYGKPLQVHHLDGNKEFTCIGSGKDILGEYGIFHLKSDTTQLIQSNWRHGKFEDFITKSSYDDLVNKYGKKATIKALNRDYDIGTPLALFIIARGDPDSWRTIDSKYGKTDILTYKSLDDYDVYTFKNSKLESISEGF